MVIYCADVQQLKELSKFLAREPHGAQARPSELDSLIGQDQHRRAKPNEYSGD
jgi:hypothetical protein